MANELEEYLKCFEVLKPALHKKVLKMVSNHETVDDILQEVQIKIMSNLPTLRLETLNAWMFRVARNEALNYLKKNYHELFCSIYISKEEDTIEKIGYYDPLLELCAERADIYQLLNTCLYQLPIDTVNLIKLHCLDGLSYSEIGEEFGKPMSTVRSKIQRGLRKLQNILKKNGFDKNMF